MAIFMEDTHIHCPKCANKELVYEPVSLFRILQTTNGPILEEESTGVNLRCAVCGEVVKHLLRGIVRKKL